MNATRKVIICGGGISGLVAAIALAQAGLAVTLLERRDDITDDGGIGMRLQSNAMAALDLIDVAERCLAVGEPVDQMDIRSADGQQLASVPIARNGGPRWPGFVGIARPALHAILLDAARNAGVKLRTEAELSDFTEDTDSVKITLTDGSILVADMLVGADGIRSTVRRLMFPERADAQAIGEGVWRGPIERSANLTSVVLAHGGRVGTIGCTPTGDGAGYLYAVDRLACAPPRGATNLADRFRDILGNYGSPFDALSKHLTGDVYYRPLETVALPAPWYRGRVIIIGDAAHAGPPTLAQGAAMGIEDAVVLAQVLTASASIDCAFAHFMERRRDRVETVLDASLVISKAQMQADGALLMADAQRRAAAVLAEPF